MIETRNLGTIGLEVIGVDAAKAIDDDLARQLVALWREEGVLLFRNVGVAPELLLNLSRCFGELEPHPVPDLRLPEYPELILLTNKGGPRGPVYAFDGVPTYGRIPWHTDLAFQEVPNAGALLNMVEKATIGGRTAWLDTAAAYDALDESLKRRIEGLEVRFEFCTDLSRVRFGNENGTRVGEMKMNFPDYPPQARPLVWKHPQTGRAIMNICPLNLQGIVGMDEAESDELLPTLIDKLCQPQFIYEHDWAQGDIILWDNYRMMHRAEGHPLDVIRLVHRTTLRGSAKVGRTMAPDTALIA